MSNLFKFNSQSCLDIPKIIFLDDLKNYTLSNYSELGGFQVNVYSSKENIEKMQNNFFLAINETEVQPEVIEDFPENL